MVNFKLKQTLSFTEAVKGFLFLLWLFVGTGMYASNSPDQSTKNISGIITDEKGEPIIGANVVVKGTQTGAITDIDGKYELNVPSNATLIVSYIGFTSKEVPVGAQSKINIKMSESTQALDEVVVVGYGTMRKADLTGSIASMKSEKIEDEEPRDIQDMLRGNVSGLNIGLSTSAKGGGDFEIRGKRTLKASSSPLYVLDGVIYYGDLQDINPSDIESVDVLKDASSAAVYGAKSANGVIIINTKKGNSGKPTIGLNINMGLSSLFRSEDVYGPGEFENWRADAQLSSNRTKPYYTYTDPRKLPTGVTMDQWMAAGGNSSGDPVNIWLGRLGFSDPEKNNYLKNQATDWKKMVFRTGMEQNYNLNISGKTEAINYYWSFGYRNSQGVLVGDDYQTFRSRLRLEAKITDFLSVGINSMFSIRDESGTPVSSSGWVNISPYGQPTNEDGTMKLYPTDDQAVASHPLYNRSYTTKEYSYRTFDNVLYAKVTLPFGITYDMNFSPRFTDNELYLHESSAHMEWAKKGGSAARNTSSGFGWQFDNIIRWKKTFARDHDFDVTLLANAEMTRTKNQVMNGSQFTPSDALGFHNMANATVTSIASTDTQSSGDALMARLFYSFKQKYLLTATVRRDGYSAFGVDNPRATFPSVALGWVFTKEKFVKVPWLNYGKLRLSWGANGNRGIGVYDALSSFSSGKITFVDSKGNTYQESYLNATQMGNRFLQWEKTNSFNVGLDFTVLNERLSGSMEFYDMNTTNLLINRSLPNVTGYASVASNLGKINNRGFEITLNSINIQNKNFTWRTSVNFSLNRNKIVSLYGNMVDIKDDNGQVIGQKEADDVANKWFIGHDINQIWDYQILGTWKTGDETEAAKYKQAPGDFHLKDEGGTKYAYSNEDKEFQGYKTPRFRWQMRNEFSFLKNFDFSFTLYSNWGQQGVFNEAKHNPTMDLSRYNSYKIPYWTEQAPKDNFARLNSSMAGVTYDVWRDLSFIRLDNVTLSYRVPHSFTSKAKISNMKLNISARNVAVWTKDYSFWDPETNAYAPSYVSFGLSLSM